MRLMASPPRRRHGSSGQAMVEFAMVIWLFLMLIIAIVEFSVLFTSYVSIGFASKDAVQVAATLGDTANADTSILERIYNDVMAPADQNRITEVDIYQVDLTSTNGSPLGSNVNRYDYSAAGTLFTRPDLSKVTLPFASISTGYPVTNRCNVNKGTGCPGSKTTVDTIGVTIYYQYKWITPFPQFVTSGSNGPMLSSANVMRLEPVQ
jgi:Flp pilus assembly protein TadG